ncbi:MAG: DUF11 domain-containing protein [Proteobacteria bacterium]|nr:DUF11 domain-containing protein [Pseudomonadota bacterium]
MVKSASLLTVAAVLALVPLRLCAAPDVALQMTVDTAVPTAGQPVQFTITASNIGTDAASGVQVTDQLPAELTIPAGMAAFPSTGTYDAATGIWSIGTLAAGANANTGHSRHRLGGDPAAVQRQCGGQQPRARYANFEQSRGRGREANRGRSLCRLRSKRQRHLCTSLHCIPPPRRVRVRVEPGPG